MGDKQLDNNVIRFDWAMKRLLRKKSNFNVLNGFLSVVLGQPVEIVELLESESNQLAADDKFNRVDLKAKNSRGEIVLIEVQNNHDITYFQRILYGTAKAITEHIHLGQDYGEVKKVYSINIVYFDFGQGEDYLYKGTTEFRSLRNPSEILLLSEAQRQKFQADSPSELFPEYYILRINNFNKVATNALEEWMSFLKNSAIPETFTAPGLPEARRELQLDKLTREEKYAYEHMVDFAVSQNALIDSAHFSGKVEGRAEGIAIGEARGIAKGRAEGEKDKAYAIARNLLSMGMTAEQVAQATGLSAEEIKQLQ